MKEAKLSSEAVTRLAGIMRASTERFEAEWRYLNESFFADCVSCTKDRRRTCGRARHVGQESSECAGAGCHGFYK